jgi:AcrR family transcriptional regulator
LLFAKNPLFFFFGLVGINKIIFRQGFTVATITEISKEAGVSEATIYEYFGTKEDLLFAIPEKISNQTYDESSKILPYIKGVEGKMRAILLSYFKLYQSNPPFRAPAARLHQGRNR